MAAITITHTRAEGTLVDGSRKGDGVYEVLKGLRASWRWMPSIGRIGLGQSRDKAAKRWLIDSAASALREAGHEVTVEIDDTTAGRDFAEAERERYERAERRADYHAGAAGSAASRSEAAWSAEHGILDMIPAGQPILVGHHSEKRHRRDLARAESLRRRASAEAERSEYHAERAQVAAQFQERREDIPRTLRRIAKLEADARRVERAMGVQQDWYWDRNPEHSSYLVVFQSCGARRAKQQAALDEVNGQIAYWREHVKAAEASGVKVWTRADFAKGDFVRGRYGWCEVERVNPKSLTIPWGTNAVHLPVVTRANVVHAMGPSQWTEKLPYDEVRGRKSAAEMAEVFAEVERRKAPQN